MPILVNCMQILARGLFIAVRTHMHIFAHTCVYTYTYLNCLTFWLFETMVTVDPEEGGPCYLHEGFGAGHAATEKTSDASL